MTVYHGSNEADPRLANPDSYFLDKYGDVVVEYGEFKAPLRDALRFENLVRSPEEISKDAKERRANIFIGMLRQVGAIEPADDVTYTEPDKE